MPLPLNVTATRYRYSRSGAARRRDGSTADRRRAGRSRARTRTASARSAPCRTPPFRARSRSQSRSRVRAPARPRRRSRRCRAGDRRAPRSRARARLQLRQQRVARHVDIARVGDEMFRQPRHQLVDRPARQQRLADGRRIGRDRGARLLDIAHRVHALVPPQHDQIHRPQHADIRGGRIAMNQAAQRLVDARLDREACAIEAAQPEQLGPGTEAPPAPSRSRNPASVKCLVRREMVLFGKDSVRAASLTRSVPCAERSRASSFRPFSSELMSHI